MKTMVIVCVTDVYLCVAVLLELVRKLLNLLIASMAYTLHNPHSESAQVPDLGRSYIALLFSLEIDL